MPSNLVAPPKKYTFRIGTCIESIFAVDSSFIKCSGCGARAVVRPQPVLLKAAADFVATTS